MLCGDLEGWDGGDGREAQREQIYVCTDSLCCTAETNLTLKQLYSNKKIIIIIKTISHFHCIIIRDLI